MASNGRRIKIIVKEGNKTTVAGKGRPVRAVDSAVRYFLSQLFVSRDTIRRIFWQLVTDPDWREKYPRDVEEKREMCDSEFNE